MFYCEIWKKNCKWFLSKPCQSYCEKTCSYDENSLRYKNLFTKKEFKEVFFNEETILYKKIFNLFSKDKEIVDKVIGYLYTFYSQKNKSFESRSNDFSVSMSFLLEGMKKKELDCYYYLDDTIVLYFLHIEDIENFYNK